MIVKKTLILQGFPDFETVNFLSNSSGEFSEFNPIFYDIETTGFTASSSFLYLIGAICYEEQNWHFYQWFSENINDEILILKSFAEFLTTFTCTIQFNGNRFDQPFLEKKYEAYHLENPFKKLPALDLYRELKPLQSLFKLTQMKQPDLEHFLCLPERQWCNGGTCIRHYKNYLKTKDPTLADIVMGHNEEDLMGLIKIFSLLSYTLLYKEVYTLSEFSVYDKRLIIHLTLPVNFPVPLSNGNNSFYIHMENDCVKMQIPLKDGKIRQYYSDYKNYDYIPTEDTAIPKSLSSFMDKTLRVPAKKETCYTWFPCNEAFLNNQEKQLQYIKRALPHYLDSLT